MNVILEEVQVDIKGTLEQYCNTRSKHYRTKDPYGSRLKQALYRTAHIMDEDFNSEPYWLTITFPNMGTLEEEWFRAKSFIDDFKRKLSQYYMVVGGIIAVEAHKNSTLKKKTGKNTKAGRPHFHLLLWFTHQFLNPSALKIQFSLELEGKIARIKILKNNKEVLEKGVYASKDQDRKDLQKVAKKYMGWDGNVNVWINHKDVTFTLKSLANEIKPVHVTTECYMTFPLVRKHATDAMTLTEVFHKIFRLSCKKRNGL